MSRSLGTLTVDIVAQIGGFQRGMTQAERESKKWRREVEKNVKAVGDVAKRSMLVFAAGFTAATAATIAMTRAGMQHVDQQMKLARSLDTSYDSITALQMAFGDGGIDSFDASLNRLNRRLGAAELGRGAALNAVKELGLNLRELSELEADERLAVIADRIKEVSNNSQEAARYAQDLGFEQQAAAQFFLQGGDAIRGYRDEVDALGLSLSDIEARQVEQANDALGIMGDILTGLNQQLAVEFAPLVEGLASEIERLVIEMGGLPDVADRVANSVMTAVMISADGFAGLRRAVEIVTLTFQAFGAYGITSTVQLARAIIDGPINAINGLIDLMNKVPMLRIGRVERPEFLDAWDDIIDEATEMINAYPDRIREIQSRANPSEAIEEWFNEFVERSRLAAEAAANEVNEAAEGFEFSDEIIDRFDKLNASLASELERAIKTYSDYYQEIQELEEEGILSAERATELRLRAEQDYLEALDEIRKGEAGYWEQWLDAASDALTSFDELAADVAENFSRQFGSAFESMIFDSESVGDAVANMSVNMARSVVNAIGQMIGQWLAYQAVQLVTGKSAQASAAVTLGANAQAASLLAGLNAFAATAAIPIVGPMMAPAAMVAAIGATQPVAAAVSVAALSGMAHDGIDSIPQTGTWLLEKGERVTTANTSAKLDKTLDNIQQNNAGNSNAPVVNIQNYRGGESTVESRYSQSDRRWVTDVVIGDIRQRGGIHKSITESTTANNRTR